MRSNEEILKENRLGVSSINTHNGSGAIRYSTVDAMKEAQLEILEELERRFDEHDGEIDMWDLLYALKNELK